MSLLMDALKQAEHAKHSPEPPPAAPTVALASGADAHVDLAELSLTPVEDSTPIELTTPDMPMAPEAAPQLRLATAPEPKAEPEVAQNAAPPEAEPVLSAPAPVVHEPADIGHHHNSPAAAARILATSAAQQTALRRRNLVGIISLVGLVAGAIGGYYYYATLAQQTPYLGLPQPPAIASAGMAEGGVDVTPDIDTDTAAQDAAPITVTETAVPAEAVVDAIAPPEQTPWQEGLPPTQARSTQDWEPAPVDPRVLRGEQPAPVAEIAVEIANEMAQPAATITITRSRQPNQVSLDLQTAYSDFQTGRLAQAEQGYRQVLARDGHNRDAHMGLAAIAVRNGQLETAREHYGAVLQRNPKDLTAHAALTDLLQNRPADSESQLKLMLTEQPQSAQLHFALANLYAEQQRWPYAQQAYFEAQRLAPEHPDYAFNLAVSLEHLGQPQLALEYYRRAIQFAGPHNAQFDLNAARQRVETLTAQVQP